MNTKIRRFDLDWLRVIVFALLIFYHVGMFFVPWGWHLKNNVIVSWMKWPMLFVNQWRLPILFVISGMGTFFALSHRNLWQFILERLKRLWIPLAFGMLVIVPPQVYFERLSSSQFSGSYFTFLTTKAFVGIYPEGNFSWHHLWFLPYLLVFSVFASPLLVYIKRNGQRFTTWLSILISKPLGLYIFIFPLYGIEAFVEPFFPVTHALIDDWFTFINCFAFFLFGYLLVNTGTTFWESLHKIKQKALLLGCICFSIQLFIWLQLKDSTIVHFSEALIKVTNLWSWILVLFGYGAQFLNHSSTILSYSNRAVYPFYILHQTITVGIGYYIMNLDWSIGLKFFILSLGTFLGSWLLYHFIIRPFTFLHPFFGLKKPYVQE